LSEGGLKLRDRLAAGRIAEDWLSAAGVTERA